MTEGKVLALYMTMPDMLRSGHRMAVEGFECDPNGIQEDTSYDNGAEHVMLLVSEKSYQLIHDADIHLDKGILLENIYVDIDLNHLKEGSIIEVGETLFVVEGPCEIYNYLYSFSPEVPELIDGNRGIFVRPAEYGNIQLGNTVKIIEEK